MSDKLMEAGFDHPCKQTCSGWQQGYDRGYDSGYAEAQAQAKVLVEALEKYIDVTRFVGIPTSYGEQIRFSEKYLAKEALEQYKRICDGRIKNL